MTKRLMKFERTGLTERQTKNALWKMGAYDAKTVERLDPSIYYTPSVCIVQGPHSFGGDSWVEALTQFTEHFARDMEDLQKRINRFERWKNTQ